MATRIVREGVLSSEVINSLSERAELFYRRLMSVADDYGRFWAHPKILHANVYSLRLDQVSEADVKQFLSECVAAKVVMLYGDGKYLEIPKFGQQTRTKSKFPTPTTQDLVDYSLIKCKSIDNHLLSTVGVGVGVGVEDVGKVSAMETFNKISSRLSVLYKRNPGEPASYYEQSYISEISRRISVMSELLELELFQKKPDSFFPQSMQNLLSTWRETLDRARTHDARMKNQSQKNGKPVRPENPGGRGL